MKRLAPIILAVPLLLVSCSNDTPEATEPTNEVNAESAPSESTSSAADTAIPPELEEQPTLSDVGSTVQSQVGRQSGMDCAAIGDCSVLFTIESMEPLGSCEGFTNGTPPPETHLVKITTLLETKPTEFEYKPGEFTIWADWSALTAEGIDTPLPESRWCHTAEGEQEWMGEIHVGDTVRRVHIADVPDSATHLRLTDAQVGSRWEYVAP